jgi:hypothetical protein
LSPYEGAEDLNTEAAVALDGVLFLEGEGRPAEITAMIGELRADADGFAGIGAWLDKAMQALVHDNDAAGGCSGNGSTRSCAACRPQSGMERPDPSPRTGATPESAGTARPAWGR